MKKDIIRKFSVPLVALLILFQTTSAQFKTYVIDSVDAPYVALLAVNPKNQKNLVAGALTNAVFYSLDEGVNWQKSVIEPVAAGNGSASILADSKGNFFYFYLADSAGSGSRIVMQRSEDGGKTWEPNEGLGLNIKQKCYQISPYVDASNDLYITWTQLDKNETDTDCHSNVFLSKSGNKGKKWSEPIQLSQISGSCSTDKMLTGSSPAVVGDQKKFAVWVNEEKIYLDRSYDGKVWLNNDILLIHKSSASIEVSDFNNGAGLPMFLSDNGKSVLAGSLYLLTTEKRTNEDVDILLTRSHNGGDNWATPFRFANDEPGIFQFKPSMTVDQETGNIYVIYYNQPNRNSNLTDVYIAYSKNGGTSFKQMKINDRSFVPAKNNIAVLYTGITASKGNIFPVWAETTGGKTKLKFAVLKSEMFSGK